MRTTTLKSNDRSHDFHRQQWTRNNCHPCRSTVAAAFLHDPPNRGVASSVGSVGESVCSIPVQTLFSAFLANGLDGSSQTTNSICEEHELPYLPHTAPYRCTTTSGFRNANSIDLLSDYCHYIDDSILLPVPMTDGNIHALSVMLACARLNEQKEQHHQLLEMDTMNRKQIKEPSCEPSDTVHSAIVASRKEPKKQSFNKTVWNLRSIKPEILPEFDISRMDVLSETIMDFYLSSMQGEEMMAQKIQLRDVLYCSICPVFPMCGLYIIGSSLNGFGNRNSDMDLCMMITNGDVNGQDFVLFICHCCSAGPENRRRRCSHQNRNGIARHFLDKEPANYLCKSSNFANDFQFSL